MSLSEMHPLFIHFPIVFAGMLIMIEVYLIIRSPKDKRIASELMVIVALLGAIFSFASNLSGEAAMNRYSGDTIVLGHIDHHASLAVYILWLYLVLLVLTTTTLLKDLPLIRVVRRIVQGILLTVVLMTASTRRKFGVPTRYRC